MGVGFNMLKTQVVLVTLLVLVVLNECTANSLPLLNHPTLTESRSFEKRSPQRYGRGPGRGGGRRPPPRGRPRPPRPGTGGLLSNPLVLGGTAVAGGLAGAGLYGLVTGK